MWILSPSTLLTPTSTQTHSPTVWAQPRQASWDAYSCDQYNIMSYILRQLKLGNRVLYCLPPGQSLSGFMEPKFSIWANTESSFIRIASECPQHFCLTSQIRWSGGGEDFCLFYNTKLLIKILLLYERNPIDRYKPPWVFWFVWEVTHSNIWSKRLLCNNFKVTFGELIFKKVSCTVFTQVPQELLKLAHRIAW